MTEAELLGEVAHLVVRDAAVERSQTGSASHSHERSTHRTAQQQTEQQPDRATADDALSRRELVHLAEIDASRGILHSDCSVMEHQRMLLVELLDGSHRALCGLGALVLDGDQMKPLMRHGSGGDSLWPA